MATHTPDCISCGDPWTLDRRRGRPQGLAGQCYDCGRREEQRRGVRRTVGLVGGAGISKSNAIGIFRHPSPAISKTIRTLNSGRYSANLGLNLGSTSAPQRREED